MSEVNESLLAAEAECAEGRTAPRVKLDDIMDAIEGTWYVSGSEILEVANTPYTDEHHDATGPLTVCLVLMKNGFTVIGKSAPASPENYDPVLGRKLAYEDAVRQIWPLMGFALKDFLYEQAVDAEVQKSLSDEAE